MRSNQVRKLAAAGVLAAAIVLLTTLASVPLPGGHGYINLGDAGVLTAGYLLGGWWGLLCAGAASALSDLLLGWAVYAPATFVIKGACALLASVCLIRLGIKKGGFLLYPVALLVPTGYFLYESMLYGIAAAALNVPLNLVQCLAGAAIAHALIAVLSRYAGARPFMEAGHAEHALRVRSPKDGGDVTLIAHAEDEGTALRAADILSVQGYTACVLLLDAGAKETLASLLPPRGPQLRLTPGTDAEEFAKKAMEAIQHGL